MPRNLRGRLHGPWVQDAAAQAATPAASAEAPAAPPGTAVPADGGEDPEKKAKKVVPSHTSVRLMPPGINLYKENGDVPLMAGPHKCSPLLIKVRMAL